MPYRDSVTGEVRVAEADYYITTIPLSLLSKLPSNLSDRCKEAMAKPRASIVGKLALQMNRRFWEEDDGAPEAAGDCARVLRELSVVFCRSTF